MADKDVHARLVVFDLDTMEASRKRRLVAWLKKLATDIAKADQKDYARKFTARLFK